MEARLGTRAKITSLLKQIGAGVQPTFEPLFNAEIAKSVLEHFWANVRARLPLTYKSDRLRPEDLLSALAYSGKGTVKIGKLLQQLGCAVLVGSVGWSGAETMRTLRGADRLTPPVLICRGRSPILISDKGVDQHLLQFRARFVGE
jgi:hypothetical protein